MGTSKIITQEHFDKFLSSCTSDELVNHIKKIYVYMNSISHQCKNIEVKLGYDSGYNDARSTILTELNNILQGNGISDSAVNTYVVECVSSDRTIKSHPFTGYWDQAVVDACQYIETTWKQTKHDLIEYGKYLSMTFHDDKIGVSYIITVKLIQT